MTIILDIGNTFIKVTQFSDGVPLRHLRFAHDALQDLRQSIEESGAENGAYVAVGALSAELLALLEESSVTFRKITVSDIPETLVHNHYLTPDTLGIDRIAAAIGAQVLSPDCDVFVVDVGTCVTYDLLTASHDYFGGNISPGVEMRLESMHEHTARLPEVSVEGDCPEIGDNTETAMRSGVLLGLQYEIEGFIHHFQAKYPALKVYLTGGGCKQLCISNKKHTFADDFLVERGVLQILKESWKC